MVEYITEKAIVRIHPGKLTEEERRVVLERAAKEYLRNIQKKGAIPGKGCSVDGVGSNAVCNPLCDRG